jgi:hypothetical protein
MNNKYELIITVDQANADGGQKAINQTISDPFEDIDKSLNDYYNKQASAKQKELATFGKNVAVAVATKGSFNVLNSWSSTLGNSHTQEQLSLVDNSVGFIAQTAVLGATMGVAGVALSLLAKIPELMSKVINYTDRKMWDNVETNKSIQRSGIIFSRSR